MPWYLPWVLGGGVGAYGGYKLSGGLNLLAVGGAALAAAYVTAKLLE